MKKIYQLGLVNACALFLLSSPGYSAVIQWEFTGQLFTSGVFTTFESTANGNGDEIGNFVFTVTFDDSATDQNALNSTIGEYSYISAQLFYQQPETLATYIATDNNGTILIRNNAFGVDDISIRIEGIGAVIPQATTWADTVVDMDDARLYLVGPISLWDSDALPDLSAFSPGDFTGTQIAVVRGATLSPQSDVDSMMVSTVPLPTSVWLFGSAVGLLGWMRRRIGNSTPQAVSVSGTRGFMT